MYLNKKTDGIFIMCIKQQYILHTSLSSENNIFILKSYTSLYHTIVLKSTFSVT
jgi:hypothetical protein